METGRLPARAGERLTLSCSCEAEIVVPIVIMLPRHHVVRILARGETCRRLDHSAGKRTVVRWVWEAGRRVYKDVKAR